MSQFRADIADVRKETEKLTQNIFGGAGNTNGFNFINNLAPAVAAAKTGFSNLTAAIHIVGGACKSVTNIFTDFGKDVWKIFETSTKIAEKFAETLSTTIVKGAETAAKAVGAVTLTAGAVGAYSVKVGTGFENSMAEVLAVAGVSKTDETGDYTKEYLRLKEAAETAGKTTKFTAAESADALKYLLLAGYGIDKSIDVLPSVLNLATAGGLDLAYASNIATDAMNSIGWEPTEENFKHFGDVLAKVQTETNTDIGELGEALIVCGGQAKVAGVQFEDTAALLGILADAGFHASQGGTMLRNLLKNMYTPTEAAADAMAKLGINPFEDGSAKDVQQYLIEITSAIENLATEEEQVQAYADIFDTRVIAGGNTALSHSGERFDELKIAIDGCTGAMELMSKTMTDTLSGDWKTFISRLEAFAEPIYEYIEEPLRNATQDGIKYFDWLTDSFNKNGFSGLALASGAVIREVVKSFSSGAVVFAETASDFIQTFVKEFKNDIPSIIIAVNASIPKIFKAVSDGFNAAINSFNDNKDYFVDFGFTLVSGFLENYASVADTLANVIPDVLETTAEKLNENKTGLISSVTSLIKSIVYAIADSAPALVDIGSVLITGLLESMAAATSVVSQVIDEVFYEITLLLADDDFALSLESSITTIIRNLGEIAISALKFINDGNNINFFDELFSKITAQVTSSIDDIMPYLMPSVENLTKKVTDFLVREVAAFGIVMKMFGSFLGGSFMKGLVSGLWNASLGGIFPSLKEIFGINENAGQLWLADKPVDESIVNLHKPDLQIADIVDSIPENADLTQEEIDKVLDEYRNANDMTAETIDFGMGISIPSFIPHENIKYNDSMFSGDGLEKAVNMSSARLVENIDFEPIYKKAEELGGGIIERLIDGFVNKWNGLKEKVLDVPEKIKQKFTGAFEKIKETVINVADTIGEKILNIFNGIENITHPDVEIEMSDETIQDFQQKYDWLNQEKQEVPEYKSPAEIVQDTINSDSPYGSYIPEILKKKSDTSKLSAENTVLNFPKIPALSGGIKKSSEFDFKQPEIKINNDFELPEIDFKQSEIKTPTADNSASPVNIQNLNVNVEGKNISSDYDAEKAGQKIGRKIIEEINEELENYKIINSRALGGVAW